MLHDIFICFVLLLLMPVNMQEPNTKHSLNNILIPCRHNYKLALLNMIESFLGRMRWKAMSALDKYTSGRESDYIHNLRRNFGIQLQIKEIFRLPNTFNKISIEKAFWPTQCSKKMYSFFHIHTFNFIYLKC